MSQVPPLANRAAMIVKLISEGRDYAQVIAADPNISRKDLFDAVMFALRMKRGRAPSEAYVQRLAAIRAKCPRAYEKWTFDEDEQLRSMHARGMPVEEIAEVLQRQVSAIRSRLLKFSIAEGDLKVTQQASLALTVEAKQAR